MEIKSEVKSIFTVAKFIDFLAFFVGIYVGKLVMGYLPNFKMSNYLYGALGAVGVMWSIRDGGLLKCFVLGLSAEIAIANLLPLVPKL
jgi:hypothetical protein